MRRIFPPLALLVAGSLSLTACNRNDSYNRPYVWHPTHANDANLAAEVVNPQDLVVGEGDDTTDGAAVVPGILGSSGGGAAKPSGLGAAAAAFGAELGAAMGPGGQGGTH